MAGREVYVGTRIRATPVGRDPSDVTAALADRSHGRVMVTDGTSLLKAVRRPDDRWRLTVVSQSKRKGRKPFGHARSSRQGVTTQQAEAALTSFLERTDDWESVVRWHRGLAGRSPLLLIPAVFVIGTAVVLGVQAATGGLDDWSSDLLPNLLVGLAVVSLITMWIALFAEVIRPRLADRIGRVLGVRIAEPADADAEFAPTLWVREDGSPAGRAAVAVVELVTVVVGAAVPVVAIGVGVVLAARPILA